MAGLPFVACSLIVNGVGVGQVLLSADGVVGDIQQKLRVCAQYLHAARGNADHGSICCVAASHSLRESKACLVQLADGGCLTCELLPELHLQLSSLELHTRRFLLVLLVLDTQDHVAKAAITRVVVFQLSSPLKDNECLIDRRFVGFCFREVLQLKVAVVSVRSHVLGDEQVHHRRVGKASLSGLQDAAHSGEGSLGELFPVQLFVAEVAHLRLLFHHVCALLHAGEVHR